MLTTLASLAIIALVAFRIGRDLWQQYDDRQRERRHLVSRLEMLGL